jgi:hypothetical protein
VRVQAELAQRIRGFQAKEPPPITTPVPVPADTARVASERIASRSSSVR